MTSIRSALPPSTLPAMMSGAGRAGAASAPAGAAGWGRPQVAADATPMAKLESVAKEFEGVFLAEFLKSAREGGLGEGLFDNSQTETFQQMLDTELARSATAGNMDLGIARALVNQLGPQVRAPTPAQGAEG